MQLLLLLLLLFLAAVPALGGGRDTPHHSFSFELLRHRPTGNDSLTDHFRHLFHSDQIRQEAIFRHRNSRRRTCETNTSSSSSFAMPLNSGSYLGAGQYLALFRVGTPAQKFLLVADTGSDLTWMNCHYHNSSRRSHHPRSPPAAAARHNSSRRSHHPPPPAAAAARRRVFHPAKSRSFSPIRCSSDMCKTSLPFSLTTCPTPSSPCAYDYGYSDGSTSQGFFANESATVSLANGRKAKLRGLIVGCSSAASGPTFAAADGVLGLGYSAVSFASHAVAAYGGRFSYCLVDHLSPRNATSHLTFGPDPDVGGGHRRHRETALVIEKKLEPFYAVGVEGISIGEEVLRIPMSVWDVTSGGGVILDSGTSLTVLAEPAYKEVVGAISRRLEGVERVKLDPFEYCYNWTAAASEVPGMVVHFAGGSRLEPPDKSYLIDVAQGVKCIGLTSTPWPGVSTIGNILQQEHIWEIDVKNRRLRFKPSSCRPRRR